jgi:hypothetical protein
MNQMPVEDTRTITISDEEGAAYELIHSSEDDTVRIQSKRLGWKPPAIKRDDLVDAVAKLGAE